MKSIVQPEPRTAPDRQTEEKFVSPQVNIYETKDGYVLEAEMAGVNKSGLEVTLENNELTLVGRRSDQPLRGTSLFREGSPASFRRVFELDPAIDTGRISAKMDQGVLTLSLPKSEQVKPRKISVD